MEDVNPSEAERLRFALEEELRFRHNNWKAGQQAEIRLRKAGLPAQADHAREAYMQCGLVRSILLSIYFQANVPSPYTASEDTEYIERLEFMLGGPL